MPKFKFQLEAVLMQRKAAERSQQVALSVIEREKVELERQMREWNSALEDEKNDLRDRLTGGDNGGLRLARFQAAAALHLSAKLRQASVRLAGVYARVEKERAVLASLAAQRQAVEKLREQRLAEWKTQRAQREWVDQDDLAACGSSAAVDGMLKLEQT